VARVAKAGHLVGVPVCLHLSGRVYTPDWLGRQKADVFWVKKREILNTARGVPNAKRLDHANVVLYCTDATRGFVMTTEQCRLASCPTCPATT
jgi:hypothetical protein